ncbi:MAG: hypothetical protein KDA87_15420 [Planctomycetales bacterium]|nr:hypothetical protein [Planctomycetales bacterium]
MCVRDVRLVVFVLSIFYAAPSVFAGLTITLNFDPSGVPTSDFRGGSDWQGVVRAAADYWEDVFVNSTTTVNSTQTLDVTWASLADPVVGQGATSWFNSPVDGLFTGGRLTLDNDSTTWFVDPTPFESSEWGRADTTWRYLGNSFAINTGRIFTLPIQSTGAQHTDLLTIALHEIGHALGVLTSYPYFANARDVDGDPNDFDVTSGYYEDAEIPISGAHITLLNSSLMDSSVRIGERRLISEVDAILVGTVQQADAINAYPLSAVPEPSAFLFLTLAASSSLLLPKAKRLCAWRW